MGNKVRGEGAETGQCGLSSPEAWDQQPHRTSLLRPAWDGRGSHVAKLRWSWTLQHLLCSGQQEFGVKSALKSCYSHGVYFKMFPGIIHFYCLKVNET